MAEFDVGFGGGNDGPDLSSGNETIQDSPHVYEPPDQDSSGETTGANGLTSGDYGADSYVPHPSDSSSGGAVFDPPLSGPGSAPQPIGPALPAGEVTTAGSYEAAAAAAPVTPPDISGKTVGHWSEHGLWSDNAALVAGDHIPNPLGNNGFDSVDSAAVWASAAIADSGAEGAVVVEEQGRYFAYEIDAKTWVDSFSRSQLEGGSDTLSLAQSDVTGVSAFVTEDGYIASPTGAADNAAGLPTEIVGLSRVDADSWATRPPSIEAYAEVVAARQAGKDLGLSTAGNEALFTGMVRARTLELLDANGARIDAIDAQYAAAVDGADPAVYERLRESITADQALAERQTSLENGIWGTRMAMSGGGMPVILPTEVLEHHLNTLSEFQSDLDAVIQARVTLRDAVPALAVIDSGDVSANMTNAELYKEVASGFDTVRDHIQEAKTGVHTGDMPLDELAPIVRSVMSDLAITEDAAADGDGLSQDALEWLDWENFKDNAWSWSGRVVAGALGIAAIVGSMGTATPAVVTALAVGGAAAGTVSSVYDFERSGDLFAAAGASDAGGRNLLDNPEAAKFARTMAYVDLALTALDLGLAAKAGTPLLKGLLHSSAAAEAVVDGTFPVLKNWQWKTINTIVDAKLAGNVDEAAAQLARLQESLSPTDFAAIERLTESYVEASRAKLVTGSYDPWTDYIAPQGTLPLGFGSAEQFQRFGADFYEGLAKVGVEDATILFQGSSVGGFKWVEGAGYVRTAETAFDVGRVSDFDIAIVSPELFEQAKALGIPTRTGGTRTPALRDWNLQQLGLWDLTNSLESASPRQLNIMIFESMEGATKKTESLIVPR